MQQIQKISDEQADEFNLFDLINFWITNWKTIVVFSLAGFISAYIYLVVTPKKFQSDALIEVAQIFSGTGNSEYIRSGLNTISLEQAPMIVERLSKSTMYLPETLRTCGLSEDSSGREILKRSVSTRLIKGLDSLIEISVQRNDPQVAKQCAEGIFNLLKQQQWVLLNEYRANQQKTLKDAKSRLDDNLALITKLEKNGLSQTIYLVRRDEINELRQKINHLQRVLAYDGQTRLIEPIYQATEAIYPIRNKVMAFGAMAGLLLGLFVAISSKLLSKWRRNTQLT